ncbi:matrix-remodeling-associated protein 5 [Scleropages formosus]|uniref:matrix-remodeling-associated protein 5 n=1 Tax=Scleropages formosus TaxID=113540 RepID=UPI0010FABF6C|nr:matrix-remodeling-associated protein 5-like [Scleropages formosus]
MTLPGVPALWAVVVLVSLLAMSTSLARSTCPKSCSCPSPREVHCTFRHLKSAPSSLPDDTERVNLGYNSIQQLGTSDFARLQRLEMLMLHGNDITTISPGAFYNLRSLQILKLSYNKLKRLDPSMFQGLQGLVRLYLDHNAISFIEPFTFSGLMSLRLLQMEGNQLRELHPHTFITISVSGCFWGSSLRHLHLADNRLEHLRPGTLQHLDRLEVLSLHGNPWACDCHLHWLQDWNKKKEGVIKCKKERNSGPAESCAACATPQHLYGSQIFHMSPEQLLCERPMLSSPLKLRDSTIWEDSEPDLPYTKDLEPPLGHLTFMLSDSHGNQAHVSCVVSRPSDGSSVTWENLKTPGQVVVNVTLVSHLECEIDRDELQKLWRLVAYYYESPAILERGPRQNNTTFQYSQTANEESPYFTELKGQLMAEPEWLLQPRVTLQLNRRRTTTKKLVLNFSAFISKQIDSWEEKEASRYSWAMIQRAGPGRIQAVLEGSDARLECKVIGSGGEKIEWMLPDLSLLNNSHPRLMSYESGILVINKVTLSDSGLYHCLLRTDNDIDVVSFRLTVRELLLSPESLNGQVMSVESGKPLLLPCSVSSVQPMEIIWYLPRNQILKPLPPNGRTYVLSNGTLVISKASHEDAGEYSCLASNLYGVDMLSHLVVITGDKDSEPLNGSGVVAEELPGGTPMKVVKPSMEDPENEGSGFQELKRSVPTKTPHTTSGRLHSSNRNLSQGNKGTKVKEAKRKLNKSVKELDPHRWAQILAKAHSKGQKVYPTTSIAFGKITPANRPTPVLATPTPTPTTTSTTPPHTDSVTITTFDYNEPKGLSTSSPIYHDSSVSNYPKPQLNVTSFTVSDTGRNQVATPSLQLHTQTEQSLDKRLMKDRVKSNNNALEGHRRRPPFRRRRPPHRRIQLINSTQNPSILSVSNSEATTSQQTSTNTKSQASPALKNADKSSVNTELLAEAALPKGPTVIDGSKKQDEVPSHSHFSSVTVELGLYQPQTPLPTVATWQRPLQPTSSNIMITPLLDHRLPISQLPEQEKETGNENIDITVPPFEPDEHKSAWITTTKNTPVQFNHSRNIKPPLEYIKFSTPSDKTTGPFLTDVYSEGEEVHRKTVPPITTVQNSAQKHLPNEAKDIRQRLNSSSRDPAEEHRNKDSFLGINGWKDDSSRSKSKSSHSPVVPVDHPWLRTKHTHKHVQIPNTQPPSTATFSWGHSNRFPIRPSIHSSRHHPSSPYRPWHSQSAAVTNRPEITALTVKATALPFASPPALIPQPPLNNSVSRTRDHLLLTRLRNRYRQSQLDAYRLSQLGKTIMLKPRTNSPTPKPHEAPKTQKSFAPVTPTPFPWEGYRQHSTASILYGSRWHYSHWGPRRLSTALPFPHLMGSGTKPRIISTSAVSVSTLAEADVILPCKSLGQPEPVLSWTKVSTGATIQANTKHGQRFEVLSNGTFVIRNVQLQDRGQYLCTAQNKFGTDRMVVTLAVLTQTPKIMHPNFKDFSVYLGRPITLDCVAVGKPQAQVSWILPDRTFLRDVWHQNTGLPGLGPPGSAAVQLLSNGTLRIQAANFSSKGNYKCIASNAAGADTLTYNINVAALPPAIEEEASESTVLQTGGNIYLHCTAKGEPPPTLKWSLPKGIQIKPSQVLGGRLFVFPNGTLYMTSTTSSDSGRYECSAVNAVGMAKRVVQLDIVQGAFSPRQHQVKAMYGSTVYLHCPESMKSPRGALWTLPSKILLDSRYSPERPVTVFPNGTLRIHQLTAKDGGSYRCMFQRANGEDMELFQVEVLMKPPKIENLETASKKVVYGANFQVDCVASGLPDPEVSWSLPDGTTIGNALQSDDSGVRSRRYVIFGNGTLLLRQMEKADEGNYTCYAKNELGEDEMRVNVRVVQDSLRILSKNQVSVKGRLGEPAYMKCDTSGDLPPTIIWLSPNNNVIASSSNRYQILEDGTLVIRKVGVDDQGKYACVSRNSAGDEIKNVKLEVEAQEPQIGGKGGKTSMKVLAVSYQTKLLHCKAEGMPNPRITWTTPQGISMLAPYHGGRFQVHQNGSLELRGLRKTDEGRFVCQAKNDLGEASLEMELEVASLAEKPSFAMPNIEVLPLKVDAHEITLECLARGKPMPEFVWLLPNGTVLNPGDRLERFLHHPSNGTLRILRPVMGDKGAYRCLAKNVAGQGEKRYSLEPGKKPQIRGAPGPMKISFGQNLRLPCLVDAWPQATITWTLPSGLTLNKPQVIGKVTYLSNGTLQVKDTTMFDRGTYSCKVTNTFGSSVLSYPVAVMVYPPRITSAPPSITRVARGSPVTLTCTATGTPKPEISWTLPGRTTLVPSNRFATQGSIHMTMEGNLVIQNPVLMNSGIYKCNAKNALGTDFKATYLQVI